MYRYTYNPEDDTYPLSQSAEGTSRVPNITAFPSQLGWPDAWLLLGEDHSAAMELLLLSSNGALPCIKALLVSWNEIQRQLDHNLELVDPRNSISDS